jgi:hypothetical protein
MRTITGTLITLVGGAGRVEASAEKVIYTPVQKVILLLQDMHAQGQKEKNEEEVKHSTYTQWCADTSRTKGSLIKMS